MPKIKIKGGVANEILMYKKHTQTHAHTVDSVLNRRKYQPFRTSGIGTIRDCFQAAASVSFWVDGQSPIGPTYSDVSYLVGSF